jgi:hypothetical protein
MRALYIAIGDPFPWDWIVLKVRSLWRGGERRGAVDTPFGHRL